MDILVLLIDGTIVEYKNVCSLKLNENVISIERIKTDSYNDFYIKKNCHFISDITGIEFLRLYDNRFV